MRHSWLALIVVIVGCDHKSDKPEGGLHCLKAVAGPGEGMNPLLDGHYSCFETPAACELVASKTRSECAASGPPHWSCSSITTSATGDPLNGVASCYPTEAMCRASRLKTQDTRIAVSECAPAAGVYCSANQAGALQCTTDQASCERTSKLAADVVHVESTPCVRH